MKKTCENCEFGNSKWEKNELFSLFCNKLMLKWNDRKSKFECKNFKKEEKVNELL